MFNAEKGLLTNPEPPDDEFCIVANCGHEVYEGEAMFEREVMTTQGKRIDLICQDCFEDEMHGLPLTELADMLGIAHRTVGG